MPKRTAEETEWMDHLDESGEDFTFEDGSCSGIDILYQNTDMDVPPQQETDDLQGLSGIPDGLFAQSESGPGAEILDTEDGFDLSAMLSVDEGAIALDPAVKQAASLANLDWLDPTQRQDPDRLPQELLPDQPPLQSIPVLEEAWGVNRRTTGLEIVPNMDPDYVRVEDTLKIDKSQDKSASEIDTAHAVAVMQRAFRRSHFGMNLDDIKTEVFEELGPKSHMAKNAMRALEAEHGLVGTVFIRASVFPGIVNGKWVKEIRKQARTARYVITDDERVADKLKMTAVKAVPWKKAARHYVPRLKAAGYEVPDKGTAQDGLRRMFLAGPGKPVHVPTPKPIDVRPADRISTEDATVAFYSTPAQERDVVEITSRQVEAARKKALLQIAKWAKRGMLAQEDAYKLWKSNASPLMLLKTGARLIAASGGNPTYEGLGTRQPKVADMSREAAWEALQQAERQEVRKAAELEAARLKKARVHVGKMVRGGLITKGEGQRLVNKCKTARELMDYASAVVAHREQSSGADMEAAESRDYQGAIQRAAMQPRYEDADMPVLDQKIARIASESGLRVGDFHGMLKWTRQQMTEGMVGKDLDDMLRSKFGTPLLRAGAPLIRDVRAQHEGLAGHLYVDADAYMTPHGVDGCKTAASKHRVNGLKYVMASERCTSCVFAKEGSCSQYRKEIVQTIPVRNASEYQARVIEMADAPDAVVTGNMFHTQEFNLTSSLDDIGLSDSAPQGSLDGIVFDDGMEI